MAPDDEGGGYVGFDRYDVVTQQFTSNHVTVSADGTGRFRSIPFRYAWPAEMDLMARIAGLELALPLGRLGPVGADLGEHQARVGVAEGLSGRHSPPRSEGARTCARSSSV